MEEGRLFIKSFLLVYIALYVLIPYVYSVASFKKKYDMDPRVTGAEDEVMYVFQVYRNVLFLSVVLTVLAYAFSSSGYQYLIPIPYLEGRVLQWVGVGVLVGALVLIRVAQYQLKESWRIGIDRSGQKTPLITTGVYRWSRNPIALGMTLSTLGFFLVLPNVITFTVLNLTVLIFAVRTRMEEEHLKEMHGKTYDTYRKATPRWL